MATVAFDSEKIFYELTPWKEDKELISLAKECLEAYRVFQKEVVKEAFHPNPAALEDVSEEALKAILDLGKIIHGIKTNQEISNVVIFSLQEMEKTPQGREAIALGKKVDEAVGRRLRALFDTDRELLIHNSGRFWYPPGGYMGWHTNIQAPGWRLYVNHAEEAGKSFFRYRDPDTGGIVTSLDSEWNFRLFRITPKKVFWHAIYSGTNRFSLGYKIELKIRRPLPVRLLKRAKSLFTETGVPS